MGWRRAVLPLLLLAAGAGAEQVKLVSWNVEWFPGREPEASQAQQRTHIQEVRHALQQLNPDVLVLVEVRDAAAVEQAIRGVNGLRLNTISRFAGRPQQVAICSRYPAVRAGAANFVRFMVGPPRGFTFAELRMPDETSLQVVGLHLKSNRGMRTVNRTLREVSAWQLDTFLRHLGTDPARPTGIALAGDLNTSLDEYRFRRDHSLRYLRGLGYYWPFAPLTPEARKTWTGDAAEPVVQFDHFLLRNLGTPVAGVVDVGPASDHRPIVVTVDTAAIARPASAAAPGT